MRYPEAWKDVCGAQRLVSLEYYDDHDPWDTCVHGKRLDGPCVACEGLAILAGRPE